MYSLIVMVASCSTRTAQNPGRIFAALKKATCSIWQIFLRTALAMLISKVAISNAAPSVGEIPGALTNASQVRELVRSTDEVTNCPVHLHGVVLWVSSALDSFIFQDDSGGLVVNTDLRKQPVQEQQEVVIEGNCLVSHGGVLSQVSINNDGIHGDTEKSMVLYLSAGLHPVSLGMGSITPATSG